jgi:hypothetical protein
MLREIIGRVAAYFQRLRKEGRPGAGEAKRRSEVRDRIARWAAERSASVSGHFATEDFSREQREARRREAGGGRGFHGTHGGPPRDSGSHKDWDARPHE